MTFSIIVAEVSGNNGIHEVKENVDEKCKNVNLLHFSQQQGGFMNFLFNLN